MTYKIYPNIITKYDNKNLFDQFINTINFIDKRILSKKKFIFI